MYKIGIIGSGPERFSDPDAPRRIIHTVVDILGFQYGKDETVFNVKGNIGVGMWAVESCMELDYKYHLFLPFSLEKTCMHWYEDQREQLRRQFDHAYSITISHPDLVQDDNTYHHLVDVSNFIVCFWAGNKNGQIFSAIQHAFKKNKIVLNGLNELKLITNKDISR